MCCCIPSIHSSIHPSLALASQPFGQDSCAPKTRQRRSAASVQFSTIPTVEQAKEKLITLRASEQSTKRDSLNPPSVGNRPATRLEAIHEQSNQRLRGRKKKKKLITLFAWPPFRQPVSDPEHGLGQRTIESPSLDAKMPPGRPARQRLVSNENDENSSTRITRAKAAALNVDELAMPAKGPLQPKKSAVNANAGVQRKRAALGDVSNTAKVDAAEGKKAQPPAKVGLVSKAAHPTGVQKNSTRPMSRVAPAAKDAVKTEKRTGSGAGALVAGPKRKVPLSSTTAAKVKEDSAAAEVIEPVRKRVHTLAAEKPARSEQPTSETVKAPSPEADQPAQAAPKKAKPHPSHPDGEDKDDPLLVTEYANDIFEYLRDLEVKSIPNPQYMSHQDDLEWKTRGILLDWLIEVHTRFHLLPETLFLAVNIIDRFLSEKVVQLDRLQLVGITAMFIASKYEEVLSPHVENFKRITDNGFSEAEILSAERFVLSTLNYDLSYPNPMNFLRRVSKADNYDIQSRTIGKYLVEISLMDHRFIAYRPSHCAAAAMYLARLMLDRGEWDDALEHYAGYTEEEVEPAVELMVDYLARPVVHEAFFKKYASKKYLKASILARQWAKKNAPLFGITDTELSLDQIS
ncbi:hypothetical protein XA68_15924 [Ophiocordyceps unilateralis]|uniref:Uncharacterized protein n=1 Tax=Ophiocordyceps unilateralis TaxID=268505 RepID=A0A2A9PKL7_OPHUN|nr:hypothetical protein XA68_15924 [Ophiocordyceps unilateralis]